MIFFIIGMRRSGTSILRTMILDHPDVAGIEFEPHPLWHAVDMAHFARFKNRPEVKEIEKFRQKAAGKCYGAKFALNPGVKALEWIWLDKTFPGSKFIFIIRDVRDTYKSYLKQDRKSVRGVIPQQAYFDLHGHTISTFLKFNEENRERSCVVYYERLVENPDIELIKVWDLLETGIKFGYKSMVKLPENRGAIG